MCSGYLHLIRVYFAKFFPQHHALAIITTPRSPKDVTTSSRLHHLTPKISQAFEVFTLPFAEPRLFVLLSFSPPPAVFPASHFPLFLLSPFLALA